MNQKRPVYLNLTKIQLPITALASILHRISGILLFLALPYLLWMLQESLASPDRFADLQSAFQSPLQQFAAWVVLSVAGYHFFAGIRHLLMDWGVAETLKPARIAVFIVFGAAIVFSLLMGVWIWL